MCRKTQKYKTSKLGVWDNEIIDVLEHHDYRQIASHKIVVEFNIHLQWQQNNEDFTNLAKICKVLWTLQISQ